MDQSTFDTFVRHTAGLLDRRSLFGGLSASLLGISGLPLAAEAKKKGKGKRKKRNKNKNGCKSAKQCRRLFIPGCDSLPDVPDCEDQVRKCCDKVCNSLSDALHCIEDIGT